MATVVACVLGGDPVRVSADTVQDAKDALQLDGNYTALVNQENADLDDSLSDEDFVSFSPAVKGGFAQ